MKNVAAKPRKSVRVDPRTRQVRVAGWQGGAVVKLALNSGSRVNTQRKVANSPTKILDLPKPLILALQRLQRALMGTESNMDLQGHRTV